MSEISVPASKASPVIEHTVSKSAMFSTVKQELRSQVWKRLSSSSAKNAAASVTNNNNIIANNQELYMIDPVTPGSIFFLPHGTRIFNKLIEFMKFQQRQYGYEEVITPLIYKKQLWEKSGHWDKYKDDMFRVEGNDMTKEEYGLKPMNCPGHCIIFNKFERSYNELPIRLSDFSSLHRNESNSTLSGLTRVRRFHQDDAHIFCTPDQILNEIELNLKMIDKVYNIFKIPSYKLKLSTRPEKFIGTIEEWDHAESVLKQTLDNSGKAWEINEGDGAFYGPKIDIILKDQFGKEHQTATIQLDFQLPQRFELKYTTSDQQNLNKTPIMIHRAIFGSLERFLSILIDHFNGKWPFWLNPRQICIIPVNNNFDLFAKDIKNKLIGENISINDYNFYIDINSKAESVPLRVKEARKKGYSYVIIVGEKELESNVLNLKQLAKNGESLNLSVEEIKNHLVEKLKNFQ